jgi:hypothetical protein
MFIFIFELLLFGVYLYKLFDIYEFLYYEKSYFIPVDDFKPKFDDDFEFE